MKIKQQFISKLGKHQDAARERRVAMQQSEKQARHEHSHHHECHCPHCGHNTRPNMFMCPHCGHIVAVPTNAAEKRAAQSESRGSIAFRAGAFITDPGTIDPAVKHQCYMSEEMVAELRASLSEVA